EASQDGVLAARSPRDDLDRLADPGAHLLPSPRFAPLGDDEDVAVDPRRSLELQEGKEEQRNAREGPEALGLLPARRCGLSERLPPAFPRASQACSRARGEDERRDRRTLHALARLCTKTPRDFRFRRKTSGRPRHR